jgi:RNA polymerase sigma-70 factor, ECF subfamily
MNKPATLGRDGPSPDAGGRADDATLIARSRAEPEAFAAIFDRHATGIHRYAARRLGPGPAEDVVGETFLVAFRRRDRYDPAHPNAAPWLFGIATNMISRHRQARPPARLARGSAFRPRGPPRRPCSPRLTC